MLSRDNSGDSVFSSNRGAPASVGAFGLLPSPAAVKNYLTSLADDYHLPPDFVQAVAQTASGFDIQKVAAQASGPQAFSAFDPDTQAYGLLQVRDDQIGKTVRDADGTPYQIDDYVKSDWRANARAGVALLAQHYQLAALENPFGSEQERAQQAYAGYTAGNSLRDRYLLTRHDGLPAHPDDRAFLQNFTGAGSVEDFGRTEQPRGATTFQQFQAPTTQENQQPERPQEQQNGLTQGQQRQAGAIAYSETTTGTQAEHEAIISVIVNRANSGDRQYVDRRQPVDLGHVIDARNQFQGRNSPNYRDFVHGRVNNQGTQNAAAAAATISQRGPTNDATAFIVTRQGQPTPRQVHNLGNVHFVGRVGNVFLYAAGPAPR